MMVIANVPGPEVGTRPGPCREGASVRGSPGQPPLTWEAIFCRYHAPATRAALAVVRHLWPEPSDEAADIAAEGIARAHAHLDSYDASRPFWPWLRTVVRRVAADRLRRHLGSGKGVRLGLGEWGRCVAAPTLTPEAELVAAESLTRAWERFRRAVASLGAWERALFLHFYAQGVSVADLARRHGRAAQTIRCALSRVKKKVCDRLGGLEVTNGELKYLARH
jgi:RNA polymerase sigma factor (sigma-70 family)